MHWLIGKKKTEKRKKKSEEAHCWLPTYCIYKLYKITNKDDKSIQTKHHIIINTAYPVGKIAEKAVCRNVFNLQKRIPSDCLFGDFAHWTVSSLIV